MTRNMFRKIFAIFPKPLCELLMKLENLIVYVFYGVLATLINYVAHFGLRIAFTDFRGVDTRSFTAVMIASENSAVSSAAAATFAWVVALIFAFFTNKFFVFESKDTDRKTFAKEFVSFAGGRLFSYGCEVAIMFIFVDVMRLNELVIKLICGIIVMILNYIFSKLLVFRKKKSADDTPKNNS
ncbi:MAG: GtrA family protein [Oscillospiraceae bacterium]|nr:GtrA family protein [Oscillospiraceae bacterium]